MKLGIGSYALAWSIGVKNYDLPKRPLTATDLLRLANQHGIGLFQIADNIPLHHMPVDEINHLRQTGLDLGVDIEVGTRGTDPELLMAYLNIAGKLGSPLVRTLITTPDMDEAEKDIRQVLPKYVEAGVALAIENHGMHTTKQLSGLYDRIGHPLVGCCLDTVNSFSALESPDQVIKELSPYILSLHIKDFDIQRIDHQMGFMVLGTPAGKGKLDIPKLLHSVHSTGRKPNAILELWPPFSGSSDETARMEMQWLEQSIEYLKPLFQ